MNNNQNKRKRRNKMDEELNKLIVQGTKIIRRWGGSGLDDIEFALLYSLYGAMFGYIEVLANFFDDIHIEDEREQPCFRKIDVLWKKRADKYLKKNAPKLNIDARLPEMSDEEYRRQTQEYLDQFKEEDEAFDEKMANYWFSEE
jgi:hypothetical protein